MDNDTAFCLDRTKGILSCSFGLLAILIQVTTPNVKASREHIEMVELRPIIRLHVGISSQLIFTSTTYPKTKPARKTLWETSENGGRAAYDGGRKATFAARFCWSRV
jgi:hypothetical protein